MKKVFLMSALTGLLLSFLFSVAHATTGSGTLSVAKLSKNDQLFREDIQYRLSPKLQGQIMQAMNGYRAKIAKMNKAEADALTDSIIQKVDAILYKMRAYEPVDTTVLSQRVGTKYLAYMLIKFELLLSK